MLSEKRVSKNFVEIDISNGKFEILIEYSKKLKCAAPMAMEQIKAGAGCIK